MVEQRQILKLARRGSAVALVTLVRVEGSSYRRPGARLLVDRDGTYAGTISGGCLEAEVVRKARWAAREGAIVGRYSTLFDHTAEMPYGLGCGGVVDLLVEPADTPEFVAMVEAIGRSVQGEASSVVTWLPDAASDKKLRRLVLGIDGTVVFSSAGLSASKIDCARKLEAGREYEGRFLEKLNPPQRLIVLGAGDDAKPLVSMAAMLGWGVTVADGRAQLAKAERFPEAEHVLRLVGAGQLAMDELAIATEDAVVLMTHSYEQDRDLLAAVLPSAPRYLGLLGARHRSSLLVSEVAARIGLSVQECCARMYAPVGLDLGGDGPEAIALAVIAEAQACVQGKLGSSRRLDAEEVSEQIARGGASRYLQAQCALEGLAV